MSGRPAYDRPTYLADIRALLARGWTDARIIRHLEISRATFYRLKGQLSSR